MKLTICGSVAFADKMDKIRNELIKKGLDVLVPITAEKIISKEIDHNYIEDLKNGEGIANYIKKENLIRRWFDAVVRADIVLFVNEEKKGIPNYIGANTFLELGLAYHFGKKIYFLNDLPKEPFEDEIKSMEGLIALNGNLDKINL